MVVVWTVRNTTGCKRTPSPRVQKRLLGGDGDGAMLAALTRYTCLEITSMPHRGSGTWRIDRPAGRHEGFRTSPAGTLHPVGEVATLRCATSWYQECGEFLL
jgi:hypothetical protein